MDPLTINSVEPPPDMDFPASKADEPLLAENGSQPRPVKFVHPSGSKPLEGYTIKRGVGRGGFGEVYFATSDAGKEVALKLIRRNLDVELRGVKHCLNLKHPNLISIYDLRTDSSGDQWVVMEFVSGESLEDLITRYPNGMPQELVVQWMQGIGAGVAYLHDHGIVHRDLKPGNVFLDTDASDGGMVKIGDYGLSKFISCSRRSGQTESVGTVHYMAPEIANGRYGREIDTYALGIMLYEMMTGHVPFEGESVGEVLMKHLTAEPDLSKLDEPYRTIVKRTLAKDPEVRIASVGELLSLLPGAEPGRFDAPRVSAEPASDGIGGYQTFGNTQVRGARPDETPVQLTPVMDSQREPLFHEVATGWRRLVNRWHAWDVTPAGKGLLLFTGVAAAIFGTLALGGLPIGLAIGLLAIYAVYYVFWLLLVKPSAPVHRTPPSSEPLRRVDPAESADAFQVAPATRTGEPVIPVAYPSAPLQHQPAARRRLRMSWRQKALEQLAEKPTRTLWTELLTSMVLSSIACAFLSLLAVIMVGNQVDDPAALTLWLCTVSSVSSWAVLGTAKLSEGRVEDQIPMRMSLLVCGVATGLFAWAMSSWLMMGLPVWHDMGPSFKETFLVMAMGLSESEAIERMTGPSVLPGMLLSIAYFALLFVGLRWWRLAEYTRSRRLSIMGVALAVCGAWLAHLAVWYPQPMGMIVMGVVAIATQIVSPWLPPSKRKALADEAVASYGGYN